MLVDIGANLTHSSFDKDIEAVLDRADVADVQTIIVTGTCVESSKAAMELVSKYPHKLFATAGIHPHESESFAPSDLAQLANLWGAPGICALGEMGLDYNRNFASRASQLSAFEQQMELAVELQAPVFVHERESADDMVRLLSKYRKRLEKIVVHCFTGTEQTLDAYIDLDLHIGITGWICDERRGTHLRQLVAKIPQGRLMLETDSPYLMPRDYPDKKLLQSSRRNEPCTLAHIAQSVAKCRGESFHELCKHTRLTSQEFFNLPK